MIEKMIERKICDYARSFGMIAYKFNSPARAAVPDRLFIYKGRFWFIEFKQKNKKPTAPQNREHDRLKAAGAIVFIVDDVQKGKSIIDHMVSGYPLPYVEISMKYPNELEPIPSR